MCSYVCAHTHPTFFNAYILLGVSYFDIGEELDFDEGTHTYKKQQSVSEPLHDAQGFCTQECSFGVIQCDELQVPEFQYQVPALDISWYPEGIMGLDVDKPAVEGSSNANEEVGLMNSRHSSRGTILGFNRDDEGASAALPVTAAAAAAAAVNPVGGEGQPSSSVASAALPVTNDGSAGIDIDDEDCSSGSEEVLTNDESAGSAAAGAAAVNPVGGEGQPGSSVASAALPVTAAAAAAAAEVTVVLQAPSVSETGNPLVVYYDIFVFWPSILLSLPRISYDFFCSCFC